MSDNESGLLIPDDFDIDAEISRVQRALDQLERPLSTPAVQDQDWSTPVPQDQHSDVEMGGAVEQRAPKRKRTASTGNPSYRVIVTDV